MIKKFDEVIEGYRLVIVEFSENDIKNTLPKAKKNLKEVLSWLDINEDDDIFIPSVRDVAVGILLSNLIKLDCSPYEEAGYGLPEFSIYYNGDARSFCGRWGYSEDNQTIDEFGLFFALIPDIETRNKISKIINQYRDKNTAYAIIDVSLDP